MQRHVTVAPARWWHLPGLSRLIRETRRRRSAPSTDAGQAIVWSPRWSPSLALLQSVWATPVPVPGVRMPMSFVAALDRNPIGLAQIKPRREPHQWEVAYLAVDPTAATQGAGPAAPALRLVPDRTAARLLGELCDAAVAHSADRVLARITDDGGRYELFRQLGFSLAVREYSYFRTLTDVNADPVPSARTLAKRIPGMRPQHRSDAFGLFQLYQDNTPKTLQLAEGKRSHSWDDVPVTLGKRLTRGSGIQRWVVERDGRKVAWLQIQRLGRGPHQVRIVADERTGELNQSLVDFALDVLSTAAGGGVIVRVREHQPRLISALEATQFILVDAQLLMAKMLATPVLQPSFAPVLEKVV
jgi:hypothetical protein